MTEVEDSTLLASAKTGDHEAFRCLTDPFRREILIHCYRMLGSLEDAEDALQETWLRAWRRLETFEGRSTIRAWIYRIATNTSLETLESRQKRSLPSLMTIPADPNDPLPAPVTEPIWLEPCPDALIATIDPGPEAIYDTRESVSLAFLAALQQLPGRQRAVLILRDVLGWRAAEVADLLTSTDASVNSALQRARETMKGYHATWRDDLTLPAAGERMATMLSDYVHAWETADVVRLVSLLRDDATLTMPPFAAWFRGRDAIQTFLAAVVFAGDARERYRLVPTSANCCPAIAVYQRGDDAVFRASALNVLTVAGDQIAEMHDFLTFDGALFTRFGLPLTS
jgi:RNA polymerase sigma-70 factor (ECF subfamily)